MANVFSRTPAAGGISNIVEDLTPQLGAMLDVNTFALGDGTLEILDFAEIALAVNELTITNAATGNAPLLSATGDDTDVDLAFSAKGTGDFAIRDPADATSVLKIDPATIATSTTRTLTMPDADVDLGAITVLGTVVTGNVNAIAPKWGKAITVEDPTSSEDISIFFTEKAITVTEIRAVLIGSSTPSVTWTVRHDATDRNDTGIEVVTSGTTTTSVTAGDDVTSFNDATIPADSYVWLETTAQSGTVTEITVTIIGTFD